MKNVKRVILGAISLLLTLMLVSCDGGFSVAFLQEKELKGTPVTKEIALPYDAEEGLDLSVLLNIVDGDSMKLTVLPVEEGGAARAVVTYQKDFDDYGFSVNCADGTLSLTAEDKYRFDCEILDVVLYADLRTCTLSGAMDIEIACGGSEMSAFSLIINGAAECDIADIRCRELEIICNGASAISAEGAADTFILTLNGAGDAEATELRANTCKVEINGAGNAEVYATTLLQAEISGVGSVSYRGDPRVEQKIGGAGSVKQLQDRDE